jgi:hypothetical protein
MAVNDSRIQQVMHANGTLWGAPDTDVVLQDSRRGSGIAYFVINPHSGGIRANDTLALPDTKSACPAVGVTQNGRGVIAFTVVGPNDFPSAGYASLDAKVGAGPVHIAAAGAGPWHASTNIPCLGGGRPRRGDSGAAVVDGDSIWFASECIAHTGTQAPYQAAPFGQCGGTRGSLGNWATRITRLAP